MIEKQELIYIQYEVIKWIESIFQEVAASF